MPAVHALLASPDIDLVLGHHAHVVQPFEQIGGEWVAYGLGNFVAEDGPGQGDPYDERSPPASRSRAAATAASRVTTAEAVPAARRRSSTAG